MFSQSVPFKKSLGVVNYSSINRTTIYNFKGNPIFLLEKSNFFETLNQTLISGYGSPPLVCLLENLMIYKF